MDLIRELSTIWWINQRILWFGGLFSKSKFLEGLVSKNPYFIYFMNIQCIIIFIFSLYYSDTFSDDAEVRIWFYHVVERMIPDQLVKAEINQQIDMFDQALGLSALIWQLNSVTQNNLVKMFLKYHDSSYMHLLFIWIICMPWSSFCKIVFW